MLVLELLAWQSILRMVSNASKEILVGWVVCYCNLALQRKIIIIRSSNVKYQTVCNTTNDRKNLETEVIND